jgi:hypothetical protein
MDYTVQNKLSMQHFFMFHCSYQATVIYQYSYICLQGSVTKVLSNLSIVFL